MAKSANNDDFKLAHPDWVSEAALTGKYLQLSTDVTKKIKKKQALAMTRRAKRSGINWEG